MLTALNRQGEHACVHLANRISVCTFLSHTKSEILANGYPKILQRKKTLAHRQKLTLHIVEAHFVSFPPFSHIWKLLASLSVQQTTVTQCAKLGKTYPWQVVAKTLTVFFRACELNVQSLTLGWTYVFNLHPLPQQSTGLISFSFSFRTNLFNLPNCHFPAQHKTGQDCVRTNESSTENSGISRKRPKE